MSGSRAWIWLQIAFGWLPVWVLYVVFIGSSHPAGDLHFAVVTALVSIAIAAALGFAVQRLTERVAWPHPFRFSFLALHIGSALGYAVVWQGLTRVVQWAMHGNAPLAFSFRLVPSLVVGIWLYVMVAGVAYATAATRRAHLAEALAARAQLAALRAQLNPHFLFNALHTVIHLIPREPERAAQATEQVAGLLRTALERDRDLVSLSEEWAFVERYLGIERIRFGDRLRVRTEITDEAAITQLPAFALQTLVENAVRHGAGPKVDPTEIAVTGRVADGLLTITVRDTGMGAAPAALVATPGTGLSRLRERLATLYDGRARLEIATDPGAGFTATLSIPRQASGGRDASDSPEKDA